MASIANNPTGPIDPDYNARRDEDEGSGIGDALRYILSLIHRNRILIAVILAASIAIAVAATMLDTPRYTAAATVQINDQSDEVLGSELDSTSVANASWDVERFLNTQIEILQSREVAQRVANSLNLYSDETFFTAMEAGTPPAGMTRKMREEMAIGLLRANLAVELPRETRIARIQFNSTSPEMSAKIANEFAKQFIQSSLQRRYDSSSYARQFISQQLAEARVELEASERELNAYAREAGLIKPRGTTNEDGESVSGGGSVTSASLSQVNTAANDARTARIAAEERWRAESAQSLMSSPEVMRNPTVQALLTERAQVDAQLETLRARYLDDYPEIVQLQAQRDSLNKQLRSVAQTVRDGVRNDYVAAAAAENRMRDQVNALQGATLAEQDRSVRYNTLAREADTNRSIYDGLLQRFRELNAAAGVANSNLSIIDAAQTPSSPSSPNLLRNLLLAMIVGMAVCAALVFLRDQFDDAIRVPEDVDQKVGLPLLGVVPTSGIEDPDSELSDPKSPISEAYNSLRGQLLYSTANGLPKIMMVTSSQPSEGKSTTSNAIAAGLARMGKRVVLVDADLRRPFEHKRHSLPNKQGLSGLLTGIETLNDAGMVHEVAPNLDVITSGPIPPSPTELLTGPRLAGLLEALSSRYDCVVLDSPPVLGLADAPVMSAMADGVVFVIESDRGRAGLLKTALRRLRSMDAVMLGAVLTKFDPKHASNKYSEYYGYEYYRYSDTDTAKS